MNRESYLRIAGSQKTRTENYVEGVQEYYNLATPGYLGGWGSSFHLPPFHDGQTLAEALVAQERLLAQDGGFHAGMRILDVGCGIGGPAMEIAEHSGAHVTGVNITPMQIEIARVQAERRGMGDRCTFVEGDAMNLPFADNTFDATMSFDALCHVPDRRVAYAEIARVTKPGGVFIGFDWFCGEGLGAEEYDRLIEPVCRTFMLPSLISLSELRGHLTAAGFQVVSARSGGEIGDMTPVWDIFDRAAENSLPSGMSDRETFAFEMLCESFVATSKAAREGAFLIGYWKSRLPM
jgi:SAM-dependent methyltransferase